MYVVLCTLDNTNSVATFGAYEQLFGTDGSYKNKVIAYILSNQYIIFFYVSAYDNILYSNTYEIMNDNTLNLVYSKELRQDCGVFLSLTEISDDRLLFLYKDGDTIKTTKGFILSNIGEVETYNEDMKILGVAKTGGSNGAIIQVYTPWNRKRQIIEFLINTKAIVGDILAEW